MSHFFSASRSCASFSCFSFLAMAGAWPPALLVEKKTGSIRSKSRSACMRSMSTEPTMPRQPTRPTTLPIFILLRAFQTRETCPTRPARLAPGRRARRTGAGSALFGGRGNGGCGERGHGAQGGLAGGILVESRVHRAQIVAWKPAAAVRPGLLACAKTPVVRLFGDAGAGRFRGRRADTQAVFQAKSGFCPCVVGAGSYGFRSDFKGRAAPPDR